MKTPEEFARSLPRTPITSHVRQVHAVIHHLYGQTEGYSVNAVEIAEHSLHEIAVASLSMMKPEEAYREQMRWQHGEVSLTQPNFNRAVKKAFEDMAAVFKNMRAERSPEQREIFSQSKYRRAIKAEREKGLAHVHAEAARVRKELGFDG